MMAERKRGKEMIISDCCGELFTITCEENMSHPDPLYDPDNSYEDDDMIIQDDDFRDEWYDDIEDHDDRYDDSMDGDHESGLASAGYGTDEDYGCYHDEDDYGSYGYGEDY